MDLVSSKLGQLACCGEHGAESSGSVELGVFLD